MPNYTRITKAEWRESTITTPKHSDEKQTVLREEKMNKITNHIKRIEQQIRLHKATCSICLSKLETSNCSRLSSLENTRKEYKMQEGK